MPPRFWGNLSSEPKRERRVAHQQPIETPTEGSGEPHIPTVALGELDDLKRSGRTPELRQAANRAIRRLKGYRTNGDVLVGAPVAGDVSVVFGVTEPQGDGLPEWLNLAVPDDRLVASALLLQSEHPGSWLAVVTSDLNLQTKLAAAGLPFVEGADPNTTDIS